ncbi:hypothetical protein Dcar01_03696 [Deinococcus carri]|uniref:Toprim domain-containing protein n=1 Tax=Deinococcus carri TaxID=1211323 RepID=A0ABP9WC76_9DEIO
MRLSDLLDRSNLPDLIAWTCGPDAVRGLHHERGGVIRDPRPGYGEVHPSFSVYRGKGGRWRWKRHGGGDADRGDALAFLDALGYSREQALEELARHAGVTLDAWTPSHARLAFAPDPLREARVALDRCTPLEEDELRRAHGLLDFLSLHNRAGHDLQRRGLHGWKGIQVGRLRRDFSTWDGRTLAYAGALGVLINGPDNTPWGLKVRNLGSKAALEAAGLMRYVYRLAGHGAPAWCPPRYGDGDGVLIVEGELNGAAAARALCEAGLKMDVQGLAGAGGTPFLDGLQGKSVFLYADPDALGAACLARVGKVAQAAGAREVRVLAPLHDGDFADLCGELGAAEFGRLLMDRVYNADLGPHSDLRPRVISNTTLSGTVPSIWGQRPTRSRSVWCLKRGLL